MGLSPFFSDSSAAFLCSTSCTRCSFRPPSALARSRSASSWRMRRLASAVSSCSASIRASASLSVSVM